MMEEKQNNAPPEKEKSTAMPFAMQMGENVGSLTFGNRQPPQGQVMTLRLTNVESQDRNAGPEVESQLFGTHIREAIAIVKDWVKRP